MRLAVVALLLPLTAHANGRAPATNGVVFQKTDPQALFVRSTFGLLVSRDNGCSFRWVCENSIGYGGDFDPEYAIADDGTIFATTFMGLRVSRDGGCSFSTATAELPEGTAGRIADIWVDALDIGPTGEVWVATAESGKSNDIYRSIDNGVTFVPRNMLSQTIWWKSLVVARSDAMHVYASGYEATNPSPRTRVFMTETAGDTWSESPLTGVAFAASPLVHVVAVDPTDAQQVFIVSVGANPPDGDRVYRSIDGAATFTEVLATTSPITNVVIDGANVFAAAGLGGMFKSIDHGVTFAPIAGAPRLGCLGKRSDGGFVGCATNWDPDFMAVGASLDAASWQKVFRFVDLSGPLECPAGTAGHDVCATQLWPNLQMQFGATGLGCGETPSDPPAPPTAGGGCCDAGNSSLPALGLLALTTMFGLRRQRRPRSTSSANAIKP